MITPTEIPAGTLIKKCYEIKQTLGKGGFGRTYLATDINLKKDCVLKEFIFTSQNAQQQEKALNLFNQEGEILSKLEHSQIPLVSDYFSEDDRLFIVQKYIDGETYAQLLQKRISQGLGFSETEILELLTVMLSVLKYLHAQGIIHRDISPDNIILSKNDKQPVLIDFGAVKQTINLITNIGNNHTGFVGKKDYAPMEQIRGIPCSFSSDLYALGVTAIVLLTGKEPNLLRDKKFEWQWHSFVNISTDLKQILNKMVADIPDHRYQFAEEVLVQIQEISPIFNQQQSPLPLNKTILSSASEPASQTEIQPGFKQPKNTKNIPSYSLLSIPVLLFGTIILFKSPDIEPICQLMGNCTKDHNLQESYNQKLENAKNAHDLVEKSKDLSELQSNRDRLNQAILELQKIPLDSKIYPQVAKFLPEYQTKLAAIDKRIVIEKKDQKLLDESEKFADSATENNDLYQAKKLWQKAYKNLYKVSPNSFVTNQAKERLFLYKTEIISINHKIGINDFKEQLERNTIKTTSRQSPPEQQNPQDEMPSINTNRKPAQDNQYNYSSDHSNRHKNPVNSQHRPIPTQSSKDLSNLPEWGDAPHPVPTQSSKDLSNLPEWGDEPHPTPTQSPNSVSNEHEW